MNVNLHSPTWLYIRQLSANIDWIANYIEKRGLSYRYYLWNIGYNINMVKEESNNFIISPEKLAKNLLIGILIIYLGFLGVATLYYQTEKTRGVRVVSLITRSMEPEIKPGSIALTKEQNSYKEGDIITYYEVNPNSGARLNSSITHRIISIKKIGEKETYITKGDNSSIPDPVGVEKKNVMGKVEKVIPNLGWMLSFVRTPPGFGMFVVLPFLIILFNELKHFKENVKIKKKRQQILFPNA